MGARKRVKRNADWGKLRHKITKGDPDAAYICTFVNPVDRRLYNVLEMGREVQIVAPLPLSEYQQPHSVPLFAEGNFDAHDEKQIDDGTYFRSHTPGGVAEKGKGYGYLLYSGLAVAVVMLKAREGIFSWKNNRSSDATRWWSAQVEQGYALEATDSMYGTTEVRVDVEDQISTDDIDAEYVFGMEADDVEIQEVSPRTVDVDVEVSGSVALQYLPAWKVAEEGIVISWNPDDSDLDNLFEDAKFPDAEVLSELNLDTVEDPELIEAVFKLIDEDSDTTDEMRLKLLNTIDSEVYEEHKERFIRMVGKQLELPLIANRKKRRVNPNARATHTRAWKDYFGAAAKADPNLI